MISSYEVGAILRIVDEASPALQKLATSAREFDGLIVKAKENLSSFASTRLAGLIGRLETVNKSLVGIGDASATSSKVFLDNFGRVDAALIGAVDSARALKAELAGAAEASRALLR